MLAGQCGDGGNVAGSGRGRGMKFPPVQASNPESNEC